MLRAEFAEFTSTGHLTQMGFWLRHLLAVPAAPALVTANPETAGAL